MSSAHHNNPGLVRTRDAAAPQPTASRGAAEQFAHELANLIDGSMRNLNLAIHTLQGETSRQGAETANIDPRLLRRLEAANTAMQRMAELVGRWMKQQVAAGDLYAQNLTVGETIEQAVQLLEPATLMRQIDVQSQIEAAARTMQAGPIAPIVINAMRNSIEAFDQTETNLPGRIMIHATVEAGQLCITIADNGPGLDAAMLDAAHALRIGQTTKVQGHGLGLRLMHEIAQSLGGTLQVKAGAPHGTVVILRYPIQGSQDT